MAGTIYVNSLWSDEAAFNADSNKPADAVWGTNAFATINGAVTEAKKSTEAVSVVIYSGEYNENINIGGRTFVEDGKTYVGGISFAAADGADVTHPELAPPPTRPKARTPSQPPSARRPSHP